MEENIDSSKESRSNEEETLKKVSITDNGVKDQSNLNNKNPAENVVNPNNQNTDKLVSNKINEKGETASSNDIKIKKEIPIEKKPFNEFVNDHLFPSLISEFNNRGYKVEEINLKNTSRPIAGDKCWVIYCEIKDTCNLWLSFEKEDISSLKSISLC